MPKRRTNSYLTGKQLVRRAVDAYLAWDDPTYTPHPKPQTSNGGSSPT